jgi:hypothetical protein
MVVDSCICYSCGQAKMNVYFSSGERVGARCRACPLTAIFLENKPVFVPRKVFGLRVREAISHGRSMTAVSGSEALGSRRNDLEECPV